jgi:tetratricopeptide (TPR) repeat protein
MRRLCHEPFKLVLIIFALIVCVLFANAICAKHFANTFYKAAFACLNTGDFTNAIINYSASIKFYPRNYLAYEGRGIALFNENRLDEAIRDYSKAIQLKVNYSEAYYNRGITYFKRGDFNKAIEDYTVDIKYVLQIMLLIQRVQMLIVGYTFLMRRSVIILTQFNSNQTTHMLIIIVGLRILKLGNMMRQFSISTEQFNLFQIIPMPFIIAAWYF